MSGKVAKYDYPSSDSGGVKPLSIRGVFEDDRHRLSEDFTDEERRWRKQWLKDQKLAPDEPRPISDELHKEIRNPIRRALSKPWAMLENAMVPVFGKTFSAQFRFSVPKLLVLLGATYAGWYHMKYNQNDWTAAYGVKVLFPKPVAFPGDENFPVKRERFEPSDYDDRGFKSRKVFLS